MAVKAIHFPARASCPYSLPKISLLSVPAWTPETPFRHSWRGKPAADEVFDARRFERSSRVIALQKLNHAAAAVPRRMLFSIANHLHLPLDAFFEVLPHTGIKTFALEQLGMRSRFGNPALIDDTDC